MIITQLEIKKLTATDTPSFKTLVDLFVEVFEEPRRPLKNEGLHALLADPLFHVFVAEVSGNIIGGCTIYQLSRYYAEKPEWFIYDVAVRQEFQNKGIGKQLINVVKQSAVQSGIGSLFVLAHSDDEQAVKFYHAARGTAEMVNLFAFDI